ncbi:MAG: ribbon-helix-helix protein, CopG family [Sulfurospirillum sp.]|nr:ribbon-helix-helix protein, CopG family [Sulfurospirillum sp.]
MTVTVRLDKPLEQKLDMLVKTLHKKKSDIIREAIEIYAKNVHEHRQTKMLNAVRKVKIADKLESDLLSGTLDDGL